MIRHVCCLEHDYRIKTSITKPNMSPGRTAHDDIEEISSDEPMQHEESSEASESEDQPSEDAQDDDMPDEMRTISFGALAEAQDSLRPQISQRSNHDRHVASASEKVDILRARLAELRNSKKGKSDAHTSDDRSAQTREKREQRSSKHAPREQTSKYQVSRKRSAVDLPNNPTHARDPRFSSLSTAQSSIDPTKLANAYSFLSQYRDSELSTLKSQLTQLKMKAKKRKSGLMLAVEAEEAEELKRQINSMENKKKSDERKDKEREVVRRHRKEEREKVKEGKNPYYMKRGEAKKVAENERFEALKGKDRRKLTERREKKRSMREKKQGRAVERVGGV